MVKKMSLCYITIFTLSSNLLCASDLNPVLQFGYDFGGRTLATVEEYDYYNGYETSQIRAGQGLSFEAGTSITNPNNNVELQFLVGYKLDQESTANGSVTWDRIPFTALVMIEENRWKFGGGLTYHLNPRLEGSFSGYDQNNKPYKDSVDDEYENSLGGVIQVQYMISDDISIGIKGTFIEYKLKNNPSIKAQGNSIGLNFSYTFGKHSEFK